MPDADDFPSLTAELAADALVPGRVCLAFSVPELSVGLRAGEALGVVVPAASAVTRRRVQCLDVTLLPSPEYTCCWYMLVLRKLSPLPAAPQPSTHYDSQTPCRPPGPDMK